ncbi:dolichol-phosphate mannosyltransferase subunit 3 [Melampsora americana]|nr:dolichol-phosphate mannosyltransferase subunit 3 [Melampsora americana]
MKNTGKITRAGRLLRNGLIASFFYVLLRTEMISIPLVPKSIQTKIIPLTPWWLLITLGAYCLAVLGIGLLTVTDCSQAYEELVQDIAMAKSDLRRRGIQLDD